MNGLRNVRILDGEDANGCTYVLTYNKYFSCRQPKLIKMGGALLLNFYNDVIILTYLVTFCIIVQCTLSLFWQRHGQCPGRAGRPSWQRGLKELSTLT